MSAVDGVVAVDRYIEIKRNVLKNADAIRNELVELQRHMPLDANSDGVLWNRFRKIESILDGLSSGTR